VVGVRGADTMEQFSPSLVPAQSELHRSASAFRAFGQHLSRGGWRGSAEVTAAGRSQVWQG